MTKIGWTTRMLLLAALVVPAACASAAAPGDGAVVRVKADFDNAYVNVSRPGERHLEIEVVAPDGPFYGIERRPPLNVALVIDKSGSMSEAGKLNYVKDAALEMVDRLRTGDRFSVISYDDTVRVLVRSEAFEDRRRARRMIESLRPGGSTNLGAGLLEGYRQVRRHYIPGGTNRVLLLSDGLANRGITSPRELSRIVDREGRGGISLAAFGVGLDFNEDLLASMAECGRGTYYYIDRPHRIPEILAREFSALERIVALDVIITIEVRPEVVIRDVMGFDYRRDGNRYHVRIGDLAAGSRRRIMARIDTPAWSAGDHRVGQVTMRYQPRGTDESRSASSELRLQYVREQAAVEKNLNQEVTGRSAVYDANDARSRAAGMVDRGDLDGAREVLRESRMKLKSAPVQNEAVRDELAETEGYDAALAAPMDNEKKEAVQKGVKYRSYRVLQSQ